MSDRPKVQISCAGPWSNHFGVCIVDLVLATLNAHAGGVPAVEQLWVNHRMGSILPQLRHQAVRDAQKREATHLLFVDSDQTFPSTTVIQLLSHRLSVVGCNVATKSFPANPTARKKGSTPTGELVFTSERSPALEKVWRLGFGIMLIELSVFAKLAPPWFGITYRPEVDDYQGEDWYFCERLEEAGIGLYVDHIVSLNVGHVGDHTYTHEECLPPGGARDTLIPDLMDALKEAHTKRIKQKEVALAG